MHQPGRNDTNAPSPVTGAPELIVAATEFRFDPGELSIHAGETVNVTLDNRGRLYHDLTIDEFGFMLGADGGSRATGAFTVSRPGRYRFICSVPGHAQAGMTGELLVE